MKLVMIDMDGVLANLDKEFEEWSGWHPENHPDRKTFFDKFLPEYTEHEGFYKQGLMPKAKELVEFLIGLTVDYDVNLCILTSAGHFCDPNTQVIVQKKNWLEDKLPDLRHIPFCVTSSGKTKSYLAHSNAFLIDDHKNNVKKFRQNDGQGFIYNPDKFDELKDVLLEFVQSDLDKLDSVVTLK